VCKLFHGQHLIANVRGAVLCPAFFTKLFKYLKKIDLFHITTRRKGIGARIRSFSFFGLSCAFICHVQFSTPISFEKKMIIDDD
jgi:hypothetical protein